MLVTLSFFHYSGFSHIRWALAQMRQAHPKLKAEPGLEFYKLMGTGGGTGLSIWPDWKTYSLLGIWKDRETFRESWNRNEFLEQVKLKAKVVTFFLEPIGGHGTWDGRDPFSELNPGKGNGKGLAVLTRASIKRKKWWRFWREVPNVVRALHGKPGLVFYKGMGELPLVEQATFSIWKDPDSINSFAYSGREHRTVIQKTRTEKWYTEELFYRFNLIDSEGDTSQSSSLFS